MCRLIPSCPYCRTITAGLSLGPRLLDVPTKQAWLSWSLSEEVDGAGAEQLELRGTYRQLSLTIAQMFE